MGNSLRDQLLKTGAATQQQASKAEHEKRLQRKQAKQKRKDRSGVSAETEEARQIAAMYRAAQAERDRELNRQREAEKQAKAVKAQVRDLLNANQVKREPGEIAFNFSHGAKIKKLYVSADQQKQLANGKLAIATLKGKYVLISAANAERLRELGSKALVHIGTPPAEGDDPYADHPIPDDLIW